jgi:hypothetical protein
MVFFDVFERFGTSATATSTSSTAFHFLPLLECLPTTEILRLWQENTDGKRKYEVNTKLNAV